MLMRRRESSTETRKKIPYEDKFFDKIAGAAAQNAERTQAGRSAAAERSATTLATGASEARNITLARPRGTEAGLVGTNAEFNGLTARALAERPLRIWTCA